MSLTYTSADLYSQTTNSVDKYISALLSDRIQGSSFIHDTYTNLWQEIQRVISSGGKRIRPYLTMIGNGEFSEKVIPIAAAQELLHIAMLIHDDVIDRDTLRHNVLNINGSYLQRYSHLAPVDATHFSHSAGLLAGDLLISEAYKCIQSSQFSGETKDILTDRLHQTIFEVIGGELMDVEATIIKEETFDPISISHYKTASYTFVGTLLSGAVCADLADAPKQALYDFGINAGIAYQLQDDLLGVFGSSASTGKSTTTDLLEGKATYLISVYEEELAGDEKSEFNATFGNLEANSESLLKLKTAIANSGAIEKTETKINSYFKKANVALDTLTNNRQKQTLLDFIKKLQARKM